MKTAPLVLLGGGGHCRSVIDVLRMVSGIHIRGILDRPEQLGRTVNGIPVVGTDADVHELTKSGHEFLITAGQVNVSDLRKDLWEMVVGAGGLLRTVISPHSYVAADAVVGDGVFVGHNAVINSGARVGDNCIINTGAIVEHDAHIGAHSHIATGAVVNGSCEVGGSCLIGSRAVLLQGVRVGPRSIVGAGAVLLTDIGEGVTVVGIPARSIQHGR